MRPTHITRHARKRIESGDQSGRRTVLSAEEVAELLRAPHALKVGQIYFAYSEVDDNTLEIITARQGRTIITVHDTSRRETRLPDMIARARAGAQFSFSNPVPLSEFGAGNASSISLGVPKERNDRLFIKELADVCSVFGVSKIIQGALETEFLHQLIVTATEELLAHGDLSKTEIKKLHCFIDDDVNRHMSYFPVWISYLLLGRTYSGSVQ